MYPRTPHITHALALANSPLPPTVRVQPALELQAAMKGLDLGLGTRLKLENLGNQGKGIILTANAIIILNITTATYRVYRNHTKPFTNTLLFNPHTKIFFIEYQEQALCTYSPVVPAAAAFILR